jgi:7,8-dihydro-6-hydroxymethylpterin-pyrophosphokinase
MAPIALCSNIGNSLIGIKDAFAALQQLHVACDSIYARTQPIPCGSNDA